MAYIKAHGLGVILTPGKGGRRNLRGLVWAADNGCYTRGDRFSLARYYDWLGWMAPARHTCLFATAPDVVGDAEATLARSLPVLPELRRLGYLPALVAQDGLERFSVPWASFGCLFIGGTTSWKMGAGAAWLAQEARSRGKLVHLGRVNSYARLAWGEAIGCHTSDGTFLARAPEHNGPRLERWMGRLRQQSVLPLVWDEVGA